MRWQQKRGIETGASLRQKQQQQLNIVDNYDYGQIKFVNGKTPERKRESGQGLRGKPFPTWQINQLGDIPNRRVVLRDFGQKPGFWIQAIEEAVRNASRNYGQKKQLKRAWRDAGAESLFDFVESQLELLKQQVPGYEVAMEGQRMGGASATKTFARLGRESLHATQRLSETRPQLASIQGWIIPSVFQV